MSSTFSASAACSRARLAEYRAGVEALSVRGEHSDRARVENQWRCWCSVLRNHSALQFGPIHPPPPCAHRESVISNKLCLTPGGSVLTTTLIDRVPHHCHLVNIRGNIGDAGAHEALPGVAVQGRKIRTLGY